MLPFNKFTVSFGDVPNAGLYDSNHITWTYFSFGLLSGNRFWSCPISLRKQKVIVDLPLKVMYSLFDLLKYM